MIEKLKEQTIEKDAGAFGILVERKFATDEETQDKINELVDAVNSLRDDCNLLMGYIAPENKCEPAENSQSAKIAQGFKNLNDPYAKYRKWAGKLCRFWDEDKDRAIYNILEEVIAGWSYKFKTKSDYIFDHCEPVKPDEDIIYKRK